MAAFNLTAQINLQGPSNLRTVVADIKREFSGIKTDINLKISPGAAKNVQNITQSVSALNSALVEAQANAAKLGDAFRGLSGSTASVKSSTSGVASSLKSIGDETGSVSKSLQVASSEMTEFGRQSALAVRRFAAFSVATGAIFGLTKAFSSAFSEFITFNREFVKLQQVTGESAGGLKSLSDEIRNLSSDLGVSSSELIKVASTLAQAGLTAGETKSALEALAKSALAPSFDNLTETTEGAIAAFRQFGIASDQLENTLGSINAVAAAFAVESADIITAIQRTGGVFASASRGVSEGTDALNEFIAVFTSVRATTRESAETIATGLRTIFTRLQRGSTIEALKDFGVSLTDLEGKFVGPYEAVKRLSEGLRGLDPRDLRFSQIVEQLGGFRQIGKVLPIIQQFATAQQALGVAQRGQSSLTKDAITAQSSLAVQFTKTREAFLGFVASLGESKTFQNTISMGLQLTTVLIQIAGAFKPLLPYIAMLGAIKGGKAIAQYVGGFAGGIKKNNEEGGSGSGNLLSLLGKANNEREKGDTSSRLQSALSDNTTALNSLTTAVSSLEKQMTKSTIGTTTANSGGKIRAFARGGYVPGSGNRDTVPAMLMPGEFVIRKKAVEKLGAGNLNRMNKYAKGGVVEEELQNLDSDTIKSYFSLNTGIDPLDIAKTNIKEVPIELTSADFKKMVGIMQATEIKRLGDIQKFGKKNVLSMKSPGGEWPAGNAFQQLLIQSGIAKGIKAPTNFGSPQESIQDIEAEHYAPLDFTSGDAKFVKNISSVKNKSILAKRFKYAYNENKLKPKPSEGKNIFDLPTTSIYYPDDGLKEKFNDWLANNASDWAGEATVAYEQSNKGYYGERFNYGGIVQKFMAGGVAELAQQKQKSVTEILLEQIEALGKAGGVKKALGIPRGDRELNSLLLPSNIRSGKNIEKVIEIIDRALEAKGIQDAAETQAIAEATKFGLVGLLPFDYSKQFGPEDIGGRSTYITARGVSSNYQDIIERMQEELSNIDTKYAQELQMRKIFSTSGPLVFDFDETLVDRSEDLMRLPNGKINIEGFNDLDLVQRDLQNISLTPLGQELKNRLDNGQLSLDNIRVVSARPQSNAPLLSQALSRIGLNIPESKITGTSGPEHKINNVTELETLIDDRLATVQQFHKAGRKAIPYAQLTSMSGPAVAAGQAALEGATIEKILGRLGAPLQPDAEPGRPIDYPDGLGLAAQYFGIDPNMPTEVKRTIDGSSLARTRGEIERYYKEIGASTFKSGGKVDPLIEKYKGIIRSILPKEMISPEGFLRTPQGTSESIDIVPPVGFLDYFLFNKPRERGAFYNGNLSYKVMRKNLEDAKSTISQEDYKVLDNFINQNLAESDSRDVINLSGQEFPAILAHETFHDIQGYLLDNYPQIYSKLLQGVESKKKDIEAWYGEPGSSKWTGYKLQHIFPKGLQDSAYPDIVGREAQRALFTDKRGMEPGLTEGFKKLREKSVLDLGRNEAIPMLMSAAAENNTTAQKILSDIFGSAGLNPDFYKNMPKFAVGGKVTKEEIMAELKDQAAKLGTTPDPLTLESMAEKELVKRSSTKNFGKIGLWNEGSRISASYLKGTGQGVGAVHADSIQASRKLFSVQSSGANQGYGPKLYDVVMEAATANGGMLVSDRLSVSQDAYGVWSKYFSSRPDVNKTPLSPEDWYTGERYFNTKAFGSKDPSTWPPHNDPAWILQTGYSKQPSLIDSDLVQKFAVGGEAQEIAKQMNKGTPIADSWWTGMFAGNNILFDWASPTKAFKIPTGEDIPIEQGFRKLLMDKAQREWMDFQDKNKKGLKQLSPEERAKLAASTAMTPETIAKIEKDAELRKAQAEIKRTGSFKGDVEDFGLKGRRDLNLKRYASGGSAQDTVPALLTPGEFVINKKAAQKIGYGKLNQLNKADKLQGFNKGGSVGLIQKFGVGGTPPPLPTARGGNPPPLPKDRQKAIDEKNSLLAQAFDKSLEEFSSMVRSIITNDAMSFKTNFTKGQTNLNAVLSVATRTKDTDTIKEAEKRFSKLASDYGSRLTKDEISQIFSDIRSEIEKGTNLESLKKKFSDLGVILDTRITDEYALTQVIQRQTDAIGEISPAMTPDTLDIRAQRSVRAGRFGYGNPRELQAASETTTGKLAEYFGGNKFPGFDQLAAVAPDAASKLGRVTEKLGGFLSVLGIGSVVLSSQLPKLYKAIDSYSGTTLANSSTMSGVTQALSQAGSNAFGMGKMAQQAGFGAKGTAAAAGVGIASGVVKGYIQGKASKEAEQFADSIAKAEIQIANITKLLDQDGISLERQTQLQNQLIDQFAQTIKQTSTLQSMSEYKTSTKIANAADALETGLRSMLTVLGFVNAAGAAKSRGGMIGYYADGGSPFKPKGTDTVPAMLTPGEFVVNKKATQQNYGLLKSINDGTYKARGGIAYLKKGTKSNDPFSMLVDSYFNELDTTYNPWAKEDTGNVDTLTVAIRNMSRAASAIAVVTGGLAIGAGVLGVGGTATAVGGTAAAGGGAAAAGGGAAAAGGGAAAAGGGTTAAGAGAALATGGFSGVLTKIAAIYGLVSGVSQFFTSSKIDPLQEKQQQRLAQEVKTVQLIADKVIVPNMKTEDILGVMREFRSNVNPVTGQKRTPEEQAKFQTELLSGSKSPIVEAATRSLLLANENIQVPQNVSLSEFRQQNPSNEPIIQKTEADARERLRAAYYTQYSANLPGNQSQINPFLNPESKKALEKHTTNPGQLTKAELDLVQARIKANDIADKLIAQDSESILLKAELARTASQAIIQVDLLVTSLKNISDSVSRASSEFEQLNKDIDMIVGGKLGKPQTITGADKTNETMFNIPGAYTSNEIRGGVNGVGNQLGLNNEFISKLGDLTIAQGILSKELPSLLAKMSAQQRGGQFGANESTQLRESLTTVLAPLNNDTIATEITGQVERALSIRASKQEGGNIAGLENDVPALNEALKGTRTAAEFLKNLTTATNSAMDTIISRLNEFSDALTKSTQTQIGINTISIESRNKLNSALGKEVSLTDMNQSFIEEIKTLTSQTNRNNVPIAGTGTMDPSVIARRLNNAEKLAVQQKTALQQTTFGSEEQKTLGKELAITTARARNLQSALQKLATEGGLAANALSKIQEQRQADQGARNLLFDVINNLDNPTWATELVLNTNKLQQVLSGQGSLLDLKGAVEALKIRTSTMTAPQAEIETKNFATEAAKIMSDATGRAFSPEQLLKLFRFNQEEDPRIQQFVNAATQSADLQKLAASEINRRLLSGADDMYNKIIEGAKGFKDIILGSAEEEKRKQEEINTDKSNQQANQQAMIDLQQRGNAYLANMNNALYNIEQTLAKNNDNRQNVSSSEDVLSGLYQAKAVNAVQQTTQKASKGGIIYASSGKHIDFKPRGTDTVPAMLTPGEFVVNRKATQKNLGLLQNINNGGKGYSSGGVIYRAEGSQGPESMNIKRPKTDYEMMAENKPHLKKWLDPDGNIKEQFIRGNPFFNFNGWLFSNEGPAGGMGRIDMMKFFGAGRNNVDGQALLFSIMNGESDLKSWYGGFVKNTKSKIDQAEPTGDRDDIGFQFRPSVIEEGIDKALLYRYLYENNGRIRSGYEGPPDPLQFKAPDKSKQGVVPLDKGGSALEAASISLARHGIPALVGMAVAGSLAPFTGGLSLLAVPIIMGVTSALTHDLINQIETSQGLKDYFDRTVAQNPEAAMAGAALPMAVATAYGVNQAGGISNMISGEISDRLIAGAAAGSADFATQATLNGLYGRDLNDINYTQIATSALMGMVTGAADAKHFKEEAIPTLRRGAGQFVGELASFGGNKYLANKAAKLLITEQEMALFKADGDAFSLVAGNKDDKWIANLVATNNPPILENRTLGLNNDGTARAGIAAGVSPKKGLPGYSAAKADPKGGGHGGPAGYFTQDVINNLEYTRREFASKLQAGYPPGAAMKQLSILRGRFTPEFLKEVENAPTLFKGQAISEDVRKEMNDALTKAGHKPIEPGRTLEDSINYFAENMGTNAASWTKFIPVTKQEAIDIQATGRQGQFDLAIHDPKAFGSMQSETLKESFAGLQAHVNAAQVAAEAGVIESVTEQVDHYLATLDPTNKEKKNAQHHQRGGLIYASNGSLINFQPRGTDTVPAMLTPGEFVVNRKATQQNLPLLKAINSGASSGAGYKSKGGLMYLAAGGGPVSETIDPSWRDAWFTKKYQFEDGLNFTKIMTPENSIVTTFKKSLGEDVIKSLEDLRVDPYEFINKYPNWEDLKTKIKNTKIDNKNINPLIMKKALEQFKMFFDASIKLKELKNKFIEFSSNPSPNKDGSIPDVPSLDTNQDNKIVKSEMDYFSRVLTSKEPDNIKPLNIPQEPIGQQKLDLAMSVIPDYVDYSTYKKYIKDLLLSDKAPLPPNRENFKDTGVAVNGSRPFSANKDDSLLIDAGLPIDEIKNYRLSIQQGLLELDKQTTDLLSQIYSSNDPKASFVNTGPFSVEIKSLADRVKSIYDQSGLVDIGPTDIFASWNDIMGKANSYLLTLQNFIQPELGFGMSGEEIVTKPGRLSTSGVSAFKDFPSTLNIRGWVDEAEMDSKNKRMLQDSENGITRETVTKTSASGTKYRSTIGAKQGMSGENIPVPAQTNTFSSDFGQFKQSQDLFGVITGKYNYLKALDDRAAEYNEQQRRLATARGKEWKNVNGGKVREYAQTLQNGGLVYAADGQLINFKPKGTDTVPAMLTPGEFVVNRQSASKNLDLLKNINGYKDGGRVGYYAGGGTASGGGVLGSGISIDTSGLETAFDKFSNHIVQLKSVTDSFGSTIGDLQAVFAPISTLGVSASKFGAAAGGISEAVTRFNSAITMFNNKIGQLEQAINKIPTEIKFNVSGSIPVNITLDVNGGEGLDGELKMFKKQIFETIDNELRTKMPGLNIDLVQYNNN